MIRAWAARISLIVRGKWEAPGICADIFTFYDESKTKKKQNICWWKCLELVCWFTVRFRKFWSNLSVCWMYACMYVCNVPFDPGGYLDGALFIQTNKHKLKTHVYIWCWKLMISKQNINDDHLIEKKTSRSCYFVDVAATFAAVFIWRLE